MTPEDRYWVKVKNPAYMQAGRRDKLFQQARQKSTTPRIAEKHRSLGKLDGGLREIEVALLQKEPHSQD